MKLKKVGTLLLAASLVTVGGVYATWTYAGSSAGQAEQVIMMNIEGVINNTAKGTLSINIPNETKVFTVDQTDTNDYTAKLKVNTDIIIKFEPHSGAESDVKETGIPTTLQFTISNNGQYQVDDEGHYSATAEQKGVFIVSEQSITISPIGTQDAEDVWTKNGNVFTYVLSADKMQQYVKIDKFIVDTYSEYEIFSQAVTATKLKLMASEKV